MRMDKLTTAVQQALSDGQSLAVQKDHNILAPVHYFPRCFKIEQAPFGRFWVKWV